MFFLDISNAGQPESPRLTTLPNEILVHIFSYLFSIDDALHLAQVCHTTFTIFDRPIFRLAILRAIITSSKFHRFDIPLCKVLKEHQLVVNFYRGSNGTSDSHLIIRPWKEILDDDPNSVTDEQVYEIATRWQGLRVLQNQYIASDLSREAYLNFSTSIIRTPSQYSERLSIIRDNNVTSNQLLFPEQRAFDEDQTARFYLALTTHWLLNECRWLLCHVDSHNDPGYLEAAKYRIERYVFSQASHERSILTEIDLLEISEFLNYHIIPRYSMELRTLDPQFPLLASSPTRRGSQNRENEQSRRFFSHVSALLQPPDLIELILRTHSLNEPQQLPFAELRPVSFLKTVHPVPMMPNFDRDIYHVCLQANAPPIVADGGDGNYNFILQNLHRTIVASFTKRYGEVDGVFTENWVAEVRGRVFWWAQSSTKAEARINRWRKRAHLKFWGQDLALD